MFESREERTRITVEGIVQGVGFRPFVYREAVACGLSGWVLNNSRGVLIEIQGRPEQLQTFRHRLEHNLPPLAAITRLTQEEIPPKQGEGFQILGSERLAGHNIQIAPDSYVCEECLTELFAPDDRRYRYPFINCTNCGPRYSIVTGIPYDRPKTTMAEFSMCTACQKEYDDPASRRFHAQPNACPDCGPRLSLRKNDGTFQAGDPLAVAVDLLRRGDIVAVKGLGGYHLAVDAGNDSAVRELRRRKLRDEKPFALMSFDLATVEKYAHVSKAEAELLMSPQRPIVLLEKRAGHDLSDHVAPRNRNFGVMLPATPLHFLLLRGNFSALVMTSGNLSDEPIAFGDNDARERLAPIADYFLSHDRAIHIRTDDSIARVMADRPRLLRRSRGFVPGSIPLPKEQVNVLAVGAELKNTFCLTRSDRAFFSQHIGDLKNLETCRSFEQGIEHLQNILEWQPDIIAHDLHPDYLSTGYALQQDDRPRIAVQHHHAHMASCMAENRVTERCIGLIFDGIGYGADGHIWGGEFLIGDFSGYQRIGHFRYLPMPGGDAATREPYRMAVSLLHQAYDGQPPDLPLLDRIPGQELKLLRQMVEKGINSPLTSSCGRLFDAVAALLGIRSEVSYEGQAALELEMAISSETEFAPYPTRIIYQESQLIYDPAETIRELIDDFRQGTPVGRISGRFHTTLAFMMVEVCGRIRKAHGLNRVVLSGGVFQNRFLTEKALQLLLANGFDPLTHALIPPNDGGLALGQAVIAGEMIKTERRSIPPT